MLEECYRPFGKVCVHQGFQLDVTCCVQTHRTAPAVSVPMHHASGSVAPRAQHRAWCKGAFASLSPYPHAQPHFPEYLWNEILPLSWFT